MSGGACVPLALWPVLTAAACRRPCCVMATLTVWMVQMKSPVWGRQAASLERYLVLTARALGPPSCAMEFGTAQMELMRDLATALCHLCLLPPLTLGRTLPPAPWIWHRVLRVVPALHSPAASLSSGAAVENARLRAGAVTRRKTAQMAVMSWAVGPACCPRCPVPTAHTACLQNSCVMAKHSALMVQMRTPMLAVLPSCHHAMAFSPVAWLPGGA